MGRRLSLACHWPWGSGRTNLGLKGNDNAMTPDDDTNGLFLISEEKGL